MEVTLAQALKLKNRLKNKVNALASQLYLNTYLKENFTDEVITGLTDSHASFSLANHLLTELKFQIYEANQNIYKVILTNENYKYQLTTFKAIHTRSGIEKHVSGQDMIYHAYFSELEKVKRVSFLENAISLLQDEIDKYNSETLITISDQILQVLK